jgi:hypothetical protein
VTYPNGSPLSSLRTGFYVLEANTHIFAPIVIGVAQTTLDLSSLIGIGTITVVAWVDGGRNPQSLPSAPVQVVGLSRGALTIIAPTLDLRYGATQFTASAAFAYPDGSPVVTGRAGFLMPGVANQGVFVDIVDGAANAVLGPFPTVSGPIPAGTH